MMVKSSRSQRIMMSGLVAFGVVLGRPAPASAQLDPLLFVKRTKPNVIVAVDTANRMQSDADNNYYDANTYTKTPALWEGSPGLGVTASTTSYRRKYLNLVNTDSGAGSDKFSADSIAIVGDQASGYTTFWERTRLAVARKAIIEAVTSNQGVARFGLLRMRQSSPAWGAEKNEGPVRLPTSNVLQQAPTETGIDFKWNITRPTVAASNGSIAAVQAPLVSPAAVNSNTSVLTTLNLGPGAAGALIAVGRDGNVSLDAPVKYMLDDAKDLATNLIVTDTECRNTIVVLIVGGGEGTTAAAGSDPAAAASGFLNVASNPTVPPTPRRVPIYVVAIAPPAAAVAQLQAIATNSGGQYFEITKAMIEAVPAGTAVPEAVRAVNIAVQHAFAEFADFNTAPSAGLPYGPQSDFQVTSPTIGTVNLVAAKDINGVLLTNTEVKNPQGAVIPQRSNVMVTTGFALPSFDGRLRAFRVYKPVADTTKPSGYKFSADGTRLWVATTPAAAASRNIYTVTPAGTMTAFTTTNAAVLAPSMNMSEADAIALITYVRSLPLGAFVGSSPAIMDPPSVDPAPDVDYPAFIEANKTRRSIVWIGANDGMMHAIDGRLGVEVWAFIPFNLLPKLKALQDGQAVGSFDYFVDSSAKVADVRVSAPCGLGQTSCWRTYLFFGQGPGGTFYQAFDVTMSDMGAAVGPTSDLIGPVLTYFSDPAKITFKWAFPSYTKFDSTLAPYGDLLATATNIDKSVGQSWSDPAVGQIESAGGMFALIVGSGFLPYSQQIQTNRGGIVAGTTLYLLNLETGTVFDNRDVGNNLEGETVDNCVLQAQLSDNCEKLKNALQADPVATGPPDSRYITKAYIGDVDGRVWRFDIGMVLGLPKIKTAPLMLFDGDSEEPIFGSMASVNVGTLQYLFFGAGSDLLPWTGKELMENKLFGVLDTGPSGSKTFEIQLMKGDGKNKKTERVTAFPAVAGDIVFFTTTSFFPFAPCTPPNANLYALTFIGGAAYDATGDNTVSGGETPLVKTVTGARATAPFIVDQHLVFGAGGKVEIFGDTADYNNGVGQAGVRIISWRDVRMQ